jgi:hypothetical protein
MVAKSDPNVNFLGTCNILVASCKEAIISESM